MQTAVFNAFTSSSIDHVARIPESAGIQSLLLLLYLLQSAFRNCRKEHLLLYFPDTVLTVLFAGVLI